MIRSPLTIFSLALFDGRRQLPLGMPPPIFLPLNAKDSRKTNSEAVWTADEDILLKTLVERYPNNWRLVADAFNSHKVAVAVTRRTPRDCIGDRLRGTSDGESIFV